MRGPTELGRDDRGVSSTVTHALALSITAVLISGLLFSAATLLEDQRENSAREQLRTVGHRIADDLSRASVLAQDGGNATIRTRHPTSIAGQSYHVEFLTGSDCNTDKFDASACLGLSLLDGRTSVMIPVRNETAVTFEEASNGVYTITATVNESAEPPSVPAVRRDLRIGIGSDIGAFASGSTVNLTNREPVAGFTFTPGQPTVSSVIHFENDTEDLDGTIISYEWDLNGDGTIDQTGREFDHSYSTPGKYTVTLTVTDDDGATDNVSKVISVGGLVFNNDADAINETASGTDADVNFTVTNQHGAHVEVLEVLIDPEDDDLDGLDTSSPSEEVEVAGDNDNGGHDGSITIYEDGAIVDLADDGTEGSANLSAGSTTTIWFRGFRDGGTLEDMNGKDTFVALRYRVNGSYYTSQFTLFGSPAGNVPPDPDFDYGCSPPPSCSFNDLSNDPGGSLQDWQWNFGDGGTSSVPNPSHTFPSNGTYDVSLTVTDDDGVSSTVTKTVLVGDAGPPIVFAVNAGGNEMTADGVTYESDRRTNPHPFHTGDNYEDSTGDAIDNTPWDQLYQTTRHADDGGWSCCPWTIEDPGSFGYDVPVPNGEYEITFKFAEIERRWLVDDEDRVFDVDVEGSTEVAALDVYDTVGVDAAYDVTRTVNVSDGELSIEFVPDSNDLGPMVNAVLVRQLDAVAYQEDSGVSERVVMEAENYHRAVPGNGQDATGDDMSGDSWVVVANGSASDGTALDGQPNNGDSAGDTENGPRLDYYVDVANTDTYHVWVRMYCPSVGPDDDSVHVGFDGQPVTYGGSGLNKNASTFCRDTSGWTWMSYAAGSRAQIDVNDAGQHTFNVWMYDDGVQIDKIVLTTDDTYTPTGAGPAESPES